MRFSLCLLLLLACQKPPVVPADADVCAPVRSTAVSPAGFAPYGHSHNDYEQPQPLTDALDAKFYSVEADIWLRQNDIRVSHDGTAFKGTLKELYLDPLQARVNANGSVYGDGVPFILWLDLKDGSAELRTELEKQLAGYTMLTVFSDPGTAPGPVTAVLTGNDRSKRAYIDERGAGQRKAIRDQGDYAAADAHADNRWSWYALDWAAYMTWDGTMTIPDSERTRLDCLVGDMHAKGAKIRFWNNPETSAYRTVAIETGIDLIGTDELQSLHDFLAGVTP